MNNWRIPLSDIDLGAEEISTVEAVLKSRWLTMGGVTQDFESAFAAYSEAKHTLAVTNATAALHMACTAIGLQTLRVKPTSIFLRRQLRLPSPNVRGLLCLCTSVAIPVICRAFWN